MSRVENPLPDRTADFTNCAQRTDRIAGMRISDVRPLMCPAFLLEQLPAPNAVQALVEKSRAEIADIVNGLDERLVLVVGPCSVHDSDQALEYAQLLRRAAEKLRDDVLIVMRVYFEKPRTTVGWKGYINDPGLDGSFRISEGLRCARRLLVAVNELKVPTATEFLDLMSPQYIADLIAWGAIGARTTESPTHRQLASGLSCPIGFKNGTDGSVQVAADAVVAARASHTFIGMTQTGHPAIFETRGNDNTHVVLRGGKNGPNYQAELIERSCTILRRTGLPERLMVDCSHANSNKSHLRQIDVARDLCRQIANGERRIVGAMIESNLEEGRQNFTPGEPLRRGVSITDACLSWTQTAPILDAFAEAVRVRHRHTHARKIPA